MSCILFHAFCVFLSCIVFLHMYFHPFVLYCISVFLSCCPQRVVELTGNIRTPGQYVVLVHFYMPSEAGADLPVTLFTEGFPPITGKDSLIKEYLFMSCIYCLKYIVFFIKMTCYCRDLQASLLPKCLRMPESDCV